MGNNGNDCNPQYNTNSKFQTIKPFFMDRANYNLNAPSYYDYLALFNEYIEWIEEVIKYFGTLVVTPHDTKTVNLTITQSEFDENTCISEQKNTVDITADVNVSATSDNAIKVEDDGLYVSADEFTYTAGDGINIDNNVISNTGIITGSAANVGVTVNKSGTNLSVGANLSSASDNSLQIVSDGLYVSGNESKYTAGTGINIDNNNVVSNTGVVTGNASNTGVTVSKSGTNLSIGANISASSGNNLSLNSDGLYSSGGTYTAGTGISINSSNVVANTGVLSINSSSLNVSPNAGTGTVNLEVNPQHVPVVDTLFKSYGAKVGSYIDPNNTSRGVNLDFTNASQSGLSGYERISIDVQGINSSTFLSTWIFPSTGNSIIPIVASNMTDRPTSPGTIGSNEVIQTLYMTNNDNSIQDIETASGDTTYYGIQSVQINVNASNTISNTNVRASHATDFGSTEPTVPFLRIVQVQGIRG